MLTPADEYLIHQTPYTMDTPFTSDRNFYDRYFFNGYQRDGEVYFAVAMGSYPNMGVFDAAFSVVHKGKQRFVRASLRGRQVVVDTPNAAAIFDVVRSYVPQYDAEYVRASLAAAAPLSFTGRDRLGYMTDEVWLGMRELQRSAGAGVSTSVSALPYTNRFLAP